MSEEILKVEEIDSAKSFFSPNVLHIANEKIDLFIQPPELTITLLENSTFEEFKIASKIISKLPHIPYSFAEITLVYLIEDFDGKISKTNFFNSNCEIFKEFQNDNDEPWFGAYLSKNYLNSRLRIDIKPVVAIEEKTKKEKTFLQFECELSKVLVQNESEEPVNDLIINAQKFNDYTKSLIEQIT